MNYTFVVNGTVQLVLIPETELDRLLLDRTLGGLSYVEIEKLSQPVSILGKPVTDSYIVRNKPSGLINYKNDSSET